jgi:hypothetical protein
MKKSKLNSEKIWKIQKKSKFTRVVASTGFSKSLVAAAAAVMVEVVVAAAAALDTGFL